MLSDIDIKKPLIGMANKIPLLLLLIICLAGCGPTSVLVKGKYPRPLTHQIPLNVGLVYDEDFREHLHIDETGLGVNLTIGPAQTELFNQVLNGMFSKTEILQSLDDSQARSVDLVIVPHVEEIQIAIPRDTKLEIFELWIKYNIQVYDSEGNPIADWIMTSYGKSMKQTFSSSKSGINEAAVIALRDTGAQLVTKFPRAPGVREWLLDRLQQTETRS